MQLSAMLLIVIGSTVQQVPMENLQTCEKALSKLQYVTRVHSRCVSLTTGKTQAPEQEKCTTERLSEEI